MEFAAVLAGQGVAPASPIFFAAEIASGRLVQPFPVALHDERQAWLVYPQERRRTRKIAAFRDWLLERVARDPAVGAYAAQARRLAN